LVFYISWIHFSLNPNENVFQTFFLSIFLIFLAWYDIALVYLFCRTWEGNFSGLKLKFSTFYLFAAGSTFWFLITGIRALWADFTTTNRCLLFLISLFCWFSSVAGGLWLQVLKSMPRDSEKAISNRKKAISNLKKWNSFANCPLHVANFYTNNIRTCCKSSSIFKIFA